MSDSSQQAKAIFLAALDDHTPEQWPAFLEQACAGDAQLRAAVEKLLNARREMGSFHEEARTTPIAPSDDTLSESPGTMIRSYRLLERLGEGGFGIVYRAEQHEPVRRKVALKVLKPGIDSKQIVGRFEAERQALALMDHPNIARVFDGGATDAGRPFFVMELVKGVHITTFCDQDRLSVRQRLELFVSVCQAVQHAHQKGVIHRDIKPSNVLVTLQDGAALVKVIDFGIAKALDQQLTDKTVFTGFAQMIGTPLYMSPEQAALSNVDVDTRSDVYSLGVLLYELLTGTTPFTQERLRKAGYDEMRRIIIEEEPPRPSTRISTLGQAASTTSGQRQSDPRRLSQLVRGELDWIVMKALEKDRNRRYESASAFAADVQRYLNDEAVQACPPSAGYRLRKFLRRHRGSVLAASLVLFTLIAGMVGTSTGLARAIWERDQKDEALRQVSKERDEKEGARRQAVDAANEERKAKGEAELAAAREKLAKEEVQKRLRQIEKANLILAEIFRDFDPREEEKEGIPVRAQLAERLVKAAEDLEGEAVGDSEVVAHLQMLLGRTITGLGYAEKAIPLLTRAREAIDKLPGERFAETRMKVRDDLAHAYKGAGKLEPALKLYRETLEKRKEKLGLAHEETLRSLNNLAEAYYEAGQLEIAMPLCLDTLAKLKAQKGESYFGTLTCMSNLANMYMDAGQLELGLSLHREVLDKTKALRGADHVETFSSMSNLAEAYRETGQLKLAKPLALDTVAKCKAKLGANHPSTLMALNNLAMVYSDEGDLSQALKLQLETLEQCKLKLGAAHPHTLHCINNLAGVYLELDKPDEALPLYREAVDLARASWGTDHPKTLLCMDNLAVAYRKLGKIDEAVKLDREKLEKTKAKWGEDYPATLRSMRGLAQSYEAASKFDLALPLYRETLEKFRKKLGDDHPETLTTIRGLAGAYFAAGRPDLAGPLFIEALEKRKAKLGADHPETLVSMSDLAAALTAMGKIDLAVPLYQEALEKMKARRPDHFETLTCMNNLGDAYRASRQFDKAVPLLLEVLKKCRETLGADHNLTLYAMNNLGLAYQESGKFDEALPQLIENLENCKAKLGPNHPLTLTTMNNLALTYRSKGKFDLAIPIYVETLKRRQETLGLDHPDTLHSMNNLAGTYMEDHKYAEAETLLVGWLAKQRKPPADVFMVASILSRLGECRLALKKFVEAEKALRESLAIYVEKQSTLLRRYNTESLLGAVLVAQKEYDKAEPFLVSGAKVLLRNAHRVDAETRGHASIAVERVIDFYTARGNPTEADKWRKLRDEAFPPPEGNKEK
jgi:serine/threonine protein kinase